MISSTRSLRRAGVLGINRRNRDYTIRWNPRSLYPLVDDKLQTKRLAEAAGIAVPALYEVVEINHQVRSLPERLEAYDDFVIKPAHGSGGNGILVVRESREGRYWTAGGDLFGAGTLQHFVSNILSGAYSLGGHPDRAMVEYRVRFDPVFEEICYRGVPDVRIIVLRGIPVMAMVRLPTQRSGGKANLHQGAIGAGIDMATGRTLSAVWHNGTVEEHPDTGRKVAGVTIPHWDELLRVAASCFELTGLGYLGVDLVLDAGKGPLMLELNARPGLNIQIANKAGLAHRLEVAERAARRLQRLEARVDFSIETFGVGESAGAPSSEG